MTYTELQCTSNFSFLQGASHPGELIEQAARLGYTALGIADVNTMAGVVRAHKAAKKFNVNLLVGCRLQLQDGPDLLAYPEDKTAYARLCGLLSKGNLRTTKGKCELSKADLSDIAQNTQCIVIPPERLGKDFDYAPAFKRSLLQYREIFKDNLSLACTRGYMGDDLKKLYRLWQLSGHYQVPMVATNDVYYHEPGRRELQDVLTCIRHQCTIDQAGYRLHPNAERHLKPAAEMIRLFRKYPQAIESTQRIAAACQFSLDSLEYIFPHELTADGRSPDEELARVTWQGAHARYGALIPAQIKQNIDKELAFIHQEGYAWHFLVVYDLVCFARQKGILCQGRGSAANSTVCYVLGVTAIDPSKFDLLFERFMSPARAEPPDIDIDFEHERREEVIQYIYEKYGRDRAAIVATVTQQHLKGAVRDVGKAMGLSEDTVSRISSMVWHSDDTPLIVEELQQHGLSPDDPRLQKVVELTNEYIGFPRQLGQHTGGFVITEGKLTDLVPIFNARMEKRSNIEWNKDDIDELGFFKVDVLALGMLSCIRKGFDLARQHYGMDLTLANIPQDDAAVYQMVSVADTVGVFQIESRAQMAMLPKMRPTCFYDLVIEVALVRPGPIQGDMVHPYLRRRNGTEPVTYPSKELEAILKRTLGVPLFQEQVMKIAMVAAGFTAAEADHLRKSMGTFKINGLMAQFEKRLVGGMMANGFTEEYAQAIFRQLKGFGSYGFPESHAASFALLVYVSAWIKCYLPEVFGCALLNSLPMGFYQPAQIIGDLRRHGVVIRPVDINYSNWDYLLEEKEGKYHALRIGFRQIKGIRAADIEVLIRDRKMGYTSVAQLRDAGVSQGAIERLADADAFRSICLDRRQALWEAAALADRPSGMYTGQTAEQAEEKDVRLPQMSLAEHVLGDYASVALSLKAHPLSLIRSRLDADGVTTQAGFAQLADSQRLKVAGLLISRQRPSTAKGVCFITLEDETGSINLVVFANLFEKYRKEILSATVLLVEGKLQREGTVVHVIVTHIYDISRALSEAVKQARIAAIAAPTSLADPGKGTVFQGSIFPSPRSFK